MRYFKDSFILFLFAILFSPTGFSQKPTPQDSLLSIISFEKIDTIKARKLNQLAYELRRNDPERAVQYANQALNILEKSPFKKGISHSYLILGTAQMNMNNSAEAFENFGHAIKEGEKNNEKKIVAGAYNNIGIIYIKQGKSSEALKYYLLGLEIREKENIKGDIAGSYLNIGNVYYQQKNFSEAVKYYLMAVQMFDKKVNKFGIANAYSNIGIIYAGKNMPDSARAYYKKALDLNIEIGDKRGISSCYENVAEMSMNKSDLEEAEKYYNLALALSVETKDLNNVAELNYNLAKIDRLRGRFLEAKKKIAIAIDISKKSKDNQQISDCYLLLTLINEKQGRFKEALDDYEISISYKDSTLNEENTKRIVEEKMNYDFHKKEALLKEEQLKKDIYAEEQLKNQKLFTRASLVVGSLILILLVLAFFAYRDKKRSHLIIESQKALVEEKQTSIIDSITYAKRLQQAVLPKIDLVNQLFPGNFILYLPKDIVAGDFYWTTETKDNCYMAICDCTGHGVPGAFMSLLNIGFLSEAINEKNILEPNKIFDYVRKRLIEGIGNDGQQDGMDGILMCFSKNNNKVTYAAAHNAPILIREKSLTSLAADKIPVGKGIKTDPFSLFNLELKKGDSLYLFTDGYADQFGGTLGKKFKNKNLEELLLAIEALPLNEQSRALSKTFNDWKGELEQVDDVLIMGIKI